MSDELLMFSQYDIRYNADIVLRATLKRAPDGRRRIFVDPSEGQLGPKGNMHNNAKKAAEEEGRKLYNLSDVLLQGIDRIKFMEDSDGGR